MKRPLLAGCICYAFGILLFEYIGLLGAVITSLTVVILSVAILRTKKTLVYSLIFLAAFGGAVTNTYYRSSKESIARIYQGKIVKVEGTFLESLKEEKDKYVFVMKAQKVGGKVVGKEKVRVNYYGDGSKLGLKYGDLISMEANLELPSGQRNPGGFNYKRYLAGKNIYSIATAKYIKLVKPAGGDYNILAKYSLMLKARMVGVIEKSLPKKQGALLEGIVLSKTDSLDEEVKNNFSSSGLSHIMAVSGVNVAFIVIPLAFLFKRLKFREWVSTIITTVILIIFTIITGASPSVVRAVLMSLGVLYGKLLERQSDIFTSIGFSSALILIYNPYILFDIGFQLSYGATLAIVLFYSKLKDILHFLPEYLKDTVAVTLSAQIGVTPIIVYYFNKLSLISLFSNILAAPLSGVTLVLGLLMALLGQIHIIFSQLLAGINYFLLSVLLFIAEKSVEIPYSTVTVPTPGILTILLYYGSVLAVVYLGDYLRRYMTFNRVVKFGAALAALVFAFKLMFTSPLEVSFIDVGQGDSIFIKTPLEKVVLIDGGSAGGSGFDAGEKIIVPFLLDKGIKRIDIIVLSHMDSDHTNGIKSVIKEFDVGAVAVSESLRGKENTDKMLKEIKNKNINLIFMHDKDAVKVEKDLALEAVELQGSENENDNSLVMRLAYKNRKFLFTGDISSEAEKVLAGNRGILSADIVKVAHHGSRYSTSDEFLEASKPKLAVISVGKNNFGHPSNQVLDRLFKRNIKTLRTDKSGSVSVFSDGNYLKVKTMNGEKMSL